MTQHAHTPGAWRVKAGTQVVCYPPSLEVDVLSSQLPAHEREANARLIAAAPEMLEALRDMLDEFDDPTITDDIATHFDMSAITVKVLQAARAAIALATGSEGV